MKLQLQEIKHNHERIWVAEGMRSTFCEHWFDLPNSKNMHFESAGGRELVHKFSTDQGHLLLRHYYRGGVPAYFTKDQFLFRGWQATRAYQEINLLLSMQRDGLPVPNPVAARSKKHGLFYTCDIIMHEILDAKTLAQTLIQNALSVEKWQELGQTIAKFHLRGYEHVDLNANNILLNGEGKFILIDFDRCQQRDYSKQWAYSGLTRLERSLNKISKQQTLKFRPTDFEQLIAAYKECS